ncbi:hypothetical protein M409DRAFT_58710 [Zasmidium cellare ATCC 36951]|uniref:Uncharacterized protein n=1 Tax=Zasmidium cellare ATCC 36951 TaxID=1080233 RepID=A0A6A6C8F4_ZASCE|nr:uncharacterized protein M409DRAFT_58710 [Zasmidium cellare ATCC 36951]KAF2161939.1 hypothetical protein M409DRAFT_58710 [Zasmidium cellare ATCC 36951]
MSQVFPFFCLPRELRDNIYAEAGGIDVRCNTVLPRSKTKDDAEMNFLIVLATATSRPRPNLLLVSRAFGVEMRKFQVNFKEALDDESPVLAPFFNVREPFQPTPVEIQRHAFFDETMLENEARYIIQWSGLNRITYEATLAAKEGSFWGLDLDVHDPGVVATDFGAYVQAAEVEFDHEFD